MHSEETDVLIAGGSLVGLSLSLFLATFGVRSVMVERHPSTSIHPRAWGFNPRTVELFRGLGLEDEVRLAEAEAMPVTAKNGSLLRVESLAGTELGVIQNRFPDLGDLSPSQWVMCGQDRIEPILRRRGEELGGRHRFSTELVSFEQDPGGVTAMLRGTDSSSEAEVRAPWLVGADGNHGLVRGALGIELENRGMLSNRLALVFRADLRPALRDRHFVICYITNADVRGGVLLPIDNDNGWQLDVPYQPDQGERLEDFTDDRCMALIHSAIGLADIEVTLEAKIDWVAGARVAERFQRDRVFLAGDAAHVMPPTGALGANTGIQDAHNLAWKLAAVISGNAGPDLLATYEAERRPVAVRTIEQAVSRYEQRLARPAGERPPAAMVDDVTAWLGYRYHSPAILSEEDHGMFEDPRHPTGQPGTRAPHVALTREGHPLSSLDLFGRRFVLLVGPDGESWCGAARASADDLGLDLDIHRIGGELTDRDGRWETLHDVTASGAVLVRPDGFIAWRSRDAVQDPQQALVQVLARLLCREAIEMPPAQTVGAAMGHALAEE
jgi:putative polyketide hydroxylase